MKFRNVDPEISSFSTLPFWNCNNLTIQLNAQEESFVPLSAK